MRILRSRSRHPELITVSAADFAQDAVGAEQCQTASDGGGLAALLDFAGGFGGIEQAAQITIAPKPVMEEELFEILEKHLGLKWIYS